MFLTSTRASWLPRSTRTELAQWLEFRDYLNSASVGLVLPLSGNSSALEKSCGSRVYYWLNLDLLGFEASASNLYRQGVRARVCPAPGICNIRSAGRLYPSGLTKAKSPLGSLPGRSPRLGSKGLRLILQTSPIRDCKQHERLIG